MSRDALFTTPKLGEVMSRNTFEMPPGVVGTGHLVDVLQGFVHELRAAGLPVSMTENIDAMRAVEYVSMEDRESLKSVLGATLVKQHRHWKAFETVFEVYFAMYSPGIGGDEDGTGGGPHASTRRHRQAPRSSQGPASGAPYARSAHRCHAHPHGSESRRPLLVKPAQHFSTRA